jgi:2-polyprenyl-6-methoxyphenol hydroxylase-like FAD-dependent oxidoreductase
MDSLGNTDRQTARALSEYAWPRDALPSSKAVMTGSSKVAIIGAGPYGLSIAAHLRAHGIDFRIFGSPMHSWRTRMPAGMFLKSEGFASNLQDPAGRFTLERFCAERGLRYAAKDIPVPLIWNDQSMHHRFFLVGSSLSSLTQRVETAEGRTRRLITLIFADRHNAAVMVVIRRELPQTRLADWFD